MCTQRPLLINKWKIERLNKWFGYLLTLSNQTLDPGHKGKQFRWCTKHAPGLKCTTKHIHLKFYVNKTNLKCFPPRDLMKSASPLLVTESVTMVDPGCSRKVIADIRAIIRFELMAKPDSSTTPLRSTSVSNMIPRSAPDATSKHNSKDDKSWINRPGWSCLESTDALSYCTPQYFNSRSERLGTIPCRNREQSLCSLNH